MHDLRTIRLMLVYGVGAALGDLAARRTIRVEQPYLSDDQIRRLERMPLGLHRQAALAGRRRDVCVRLVDSCFRCDEMCESLRKEGR